MTAGPIPEKITYEVWREFVGRDVQDTLYAGNMNARLSLACLRECERDTADLPQLRFYRVRVISVRQRVEES